MQTLSVKLFSCKIIQKHTPKNCVPFEVQFFSRAFRQQWINEGLSVLDSFSPKIVLKTNQYMRYSDTVLMNKSDYMNNVLFVSET